MTAEKPTYEELALRVESLETSARQHKLDEEIWQEGEEKFRRLFDYCPMGIFIYELTADGSLVFINANRAADTILGVNCRQLLGKRIEEAFPPLAETFIPAKYREVAAGGKIWESEHIDYAHGKISGAFKVVAFQTKPNELACMFEDITDHKQANVELLESREKYYLLSEGAFEAIVWHDKGKIIEANDQYYDMFGYKPEELAGKDAMAMTATPDSVEFMRKQISADRLGPYQVSGLKKDGTVFPMEIRVKQMKHQGRTARMAAIRDLSEQKETETALNESERKYKTLIENANSIILRWDPNGHIIYLNPYGLDYFKYEKDEVVGAHAVGTIVPEEETSGRNLREMIKDITKNPLRYKNNLNQNMRSDGERVWVQWTNVPIVDAAGEFVEILSIGNDITEKVLAEEALRSREEELKAQTRHLKEVNTAMKVLLKKREEDKNELEEKVLLNVKDLVVNYLEKLKHSGLDSKQKTYVDIIDSNLNHIVSPFLRRLSRHYGNLTPTEVGVAKLVKQGKTSKEIAELFNLSPRTIEFHRDNIREKMGLKNKKINLRTHLLSIN